jgi:hypothetical protein
VEWIRPLSIWAKLWIILSSWRSITLCENSVGCHNVCCSCQCFQTFNWYRSTNASQICWRILETMQQPSHLGWKENKTTVVVWTYLFFFKWCSGSFGRPYKKYKLWIFLENVIWRVSVGFDYSLSWECLYTLLHSEMNLENVNS